MSAVVLFLGLAFAFLAVGFIVGTVEAFGTRQWFNGFLGLAALAMLGGVLSLAASTGLVSMLVAAQ